ncbi:MAG: cyclin-like protein [Monoraphidium minutum]|nr:MAG: cyclin-like protein [Monoraphidium minutum]
MLWEATAADASPQDHDLCCESPYDASISGQSSPAESSASDSDSCYVMGSPRTPVAAWGPSKSSVDALEQERDYAEHLREMELSNRVEPDYMSRHARAPGGAPLAPTARASAVDWMVDGAWQLGISNDALCLGVALLDRYLAARARAGAAAAAAAGARLPLVAATCLWVAAKYEHMQAPPLDMFSRCLLHNAYPAAAFLEMEADLLTAVDYRLASITTAKTFLRRIMFDLGELEAKAGSKVDEALYFLTSYLVECSLLEYGLLSAPPSRVAGAALVLAHALLGRPLGAARLEALTGCAAAELTAPLRWLRQVHAVLSQAGGLYAVTVKYQSPEMARVAAVPAILGLADGRLAAAAPPPPAAPAAPPAACAAGRRAAAPVAAAAVVVA